MVTFDQCQNYWSNINKNNYLKLPSLTELVQHDFLSSEVLDSGGSISHFSMHTDFLDAFNKKGKVKQSIKHNHDFKSFESITLTLILMKTIKLLRLLEGTY